MSNHSIYNKSPKFQYNDKVRIKGVQYDNPHKYHTINHILINDNGEIQYTLDIGTICIEEELKTYNLDFTNNTYTVTLNISYSSFMTNKMKLDPLLFHGLTEKDIQVLPVIISEAIAKLKTKDNNGIEFS